MYFKWNIQRKIRAFLRIELLFLLLLTNNAFAQVNSEYLKSLEGEASHLSLDSQTTKSNQKTLPRRVKSFGLDLNGKKGGAIAELVAGLSQAQFERVLKNNYMGSYLFYKRLSVDKKADVYGFYQDNPDPQKVREKILQVNKK